MGIGNGLAARFGSRIKRPIVAYAVLELVVAITGLALVIGLSHLAPLLAGSLAFLKRFDLLLQAARFAGGFVLLLAPGIAMGATLPILVQALSGGGTRFGSVLGGLYGINTLGAVCGAASVELLWIPMFGIRGSGVLAADGRG